MYKSSYTSLRNTYIFCHKVHFPHIYTFRTKLIQFNSIIKIYIWSMCAYKKYGKYPLHLFLFFFFYTVELMHYIFDWIVTQYKHCYACTQYGMEVWKVIIILWIFFLFTYFIHRILKDKTKDEQKKTIFFSCSIKCIDLIS